MSFPAGLQAVPIGNFASIVTPDGWGSQSPFGLTPNQVRGAYGLGTYTSGNLSNVISFGGVDGDGSGQTIAIVNAYDAPSLLDTTDSNFATSDLHRFDMEFDLPDPPSFVKLTQSGEPVSTDPNSPNYVPTDPNGPYQTTGKQFDWETEESMDVESAHVVAPMANIILFEATNFSPNDMFTAVLNAAKTTGVVVVSISWSMPEFSSEAAQDPYFGTPFGHMGGSSPLGGAAIPGGVTFLAAAGDYGPYAPGTSTITAQWPAVSPNVVAVGGTSLYPSSATETAWGNGADSWQLGGGGGGISLYETQPSYQIGVVSSSITTTQRAYPDVSADGNWSTGVPVCDSWDFGNLSPWSPAAEGGSSLATPLWAGIIAVADEGRAIDGVGSLDGATQTLPYLYRLAPTDLNDITWNTSATLPGNTMPGPSTGPTALYDPGPGYDLATGLGTPEANLLVPDLLPPMVTVGLAAGQSDAAVSSATFVVTFSQPVTGFNINSVTLTQVGLGTSSVFSVTPVGASATAYDVVVDGNVSGKHYDTVALSVPVGSVEDLAGIGNVAATVAPGSTNVVTFVQNLYYDGSGTWDPLSSSWFAGSSGSGVLVQWANGAAAVFPGGGTVFLATGFNPNPASITFQTGTTTLNDGELSLASGTTIDVAAGTTATIGATVDCTDLCPNLPGGTLVLNGDDSLVTGVTVTCTSAGTLELGDGTSSNSLPTGYVSIEDSSTPPATLVFDVPSGATQAFTSNISGDVAVTKMRLGTLSLTGANTYTGNTTVQTGILNIQNALALDVMAGSVVNVSNGATLQLQGGIAVASSGMLELAGAGYNNQGALENVLDDNTWSGPIQFGGATDINCNAGTLALTGVISGSGGLSKTGAGTLGLSAVNVFTGGTTVERRSPDDHRTGRASERLESRRRRRRQFHF